MFVKDNPGQPVLFAHYSLYVLIAKYWLAFPPALPWPVWHLQWIILSLSGELAE